MEKETPFNRNELLKWTVKEFKGNLIYIAWQNAAQKRYQDIVSKRK